MPPVRANVYSVWIQYTGSNANEVGATVGGDFSLVSETGGVMTAWSCGNLHEINAGLWIEVHHDCIVRVCTKADFDKDYMLVQSPPAAFTSVGVATVPPLLLGASTTLNVSISPAQSSANFTPKLSLLGAPAVIGPLAITGMSVVNASTVSVTVRASVAYLGGAQVLVLA